MEKVLFYTYPSCTSCRKTKKWLTSNEVAFQERHLFRQTPTREELLNLLKMTSEGVEELLATRGQAFKSLNIEIDDLSLNEAIDLMVENPKLLKRPIITDGHRLFVGYHPDQFLALKKKSKLSKAV